MVLGSFAESLLLLLVVNLAAGADGRRAWLAALLVIPAQLVLGFLFVIIIPSAPLPLASLFVLIVAVFFCFLKPRRWQFLKVTSVATVLAFGIVCVRLFVAVEDNKALAREYPYESLADRLAYEAKHSLAPPSASASPARLQEYENLLGNKISMDLEMRMRAKSLRFIHASFLKQFVRSPGFGIARVPVVPSRESLSPAEPVSIAQPKAASAVALRASDSQNPEPLNAQAVDVHDAGLASVHNRSIIDFVNARGFGDALDRYQVAGFQAHQFHERPDFPSIADGKPRWTLERLDLVSLLKHDKSCAYVSEHLPRMDELRDAPTRPLDRFEQKALAALQGGEDIMVSAGPGPIHMLGAIRALNECVVCHDARRGELLGAFSYVLRRER
jgi:hypothetical protein